MSLDIWTRCAGPSRTRSIKERVWRVVEAQHKVSTRRLVDTHEEQELLERIIDEVKPPRPTEPRFAGLHYLLFTPFRHPPLRRGSRFGSATERSIWYGALRIETALSEKAYYQLLFAAGPRTQLKDLACDWTAFRVDVATEKGIDLTAAPFIDYGAQVSSPSSYAAAQPLGRQMREAGIEGFLYRSARCLDGGTALGLFEPVFSTRTLDGKYFQTWRCAVTDQGCEVVHLNDPGSRTLIFPRSAFEVRGTFPSPAI